MVLLKVYKRLMRAGNKEDKDFSLRCEVIREEEMDTN